MTGLRSGHDPGGLATTLMTHAGLYGELAGVEWKEEKARLTGMLVCLMLVFIFLLCLLLTVGALVLVVSWNTPYRLLSLAGLAGVYALCAVLAWYRFRVLGDRSEDAFADTREELAVDVALLRKRLEL